MRIKSITVRNFKSLRDVVMEDLGKLTIIIGKNSSGKSSFIEAIKLFFDEFTADLERQVGIPDDSIWHDRNLEHPIEIALDLSLTEVERKRLVPDEWLSKVGLKRVENRISISRQLSSTGDGGAIWRTDDIRMGQSILLRKAELVVRREKGNSPSASEQHLEATGELLTYLRDGLQGRLRVVEAARDSSTTFQAMGSRQTMIPGDVVSRLVSLQQSRERSDERKWSRLVSLVEQMESSLSPEVAQGNLLSRVGDLRLPIAYAGGGDQAVLALAEALIGKIDFIAIEEPESHMHPALARDVFEILRNTSKRVQAFVVTHSPIFVDRADPMSTWIFKADGIETKASRVSEEGEFRKVLLEIGQRPSDIFFSDRLLFVEGQTDRQVLPILAERIGVNGFAREIAIIPTRGVTKMRYHLKMWATIAVDVQIPFAILVDKSGRDEAKAAVSAGFVKRNHAMWLNEGDIEDYYPPRLLVGALEGIYAIKLKENEKKDLGEHPRAEKIAAVLRSHGKLSDGRWRKVDVGVEVASKMTSSDIKQELRRKLERVSTLLA